MPSVRQLAVIVAVAAGYARRRARVCRAGGAPIRRTACAAPPRARCGAWERGWAMSQRRRPCDDRVRPGRAGHPADRAAGPARTDSRADRVCSSTTTAADLLAERMAPLVVERGFRSFLDLYYLLKYDEAAAVGGWRQVMDALSVPETYFWREMDQIRAIVCRVVPELARRGAGVHSDLERAVRDGRGAADDRDGAERGRLVRSRPDRDPRQRRQRRGDRARRRAGRYRQRVDARAAAGDGSRNISPPTAARSRRRPDLARRITSWSVVNLMVARRGRAVRASSRLCSAGTRSSISRRRRSSGWSSSWRRAMPTPAYLCVGASESLLNVTSAFSLEEIDRRVRLREAERR